MRPPAIRNRGMIDQRQQAYLDAMGIETWCLRKSPLVAESLRKTPTSQITSAGNTPADVAPSPSSEVAEGAGVKLGPGRGGVLLVCAEDTESASRLSNDINRAMGGTPVWGWLHSGDKAVGLADAVEENLFTTVAIFGEELGRQFFEGGLPDSLNSANLVILPSMRDLKVDAEARKLLWNALCRFGMVSACDRQA